MGDMVELGGGERGYLAPPRQGAGLALVVLHEHWGLVPHIEDVCDRFAVEGFCALAPDLFRGETASEPDEARELMMSLDLGSAAGDMGAAIDHLVASPLVRGDGVGVVGFSMGGGLALILAISRPTDVRASVNFYGLVPWHSAQPDWSQLQVPVQGHFGERDDLLSPDEVHEVEATFAEHGKDAEFFLYPGAGHGFFDDTRPPSYDESAASMAWTRSLEFLRAKLG